LIRRRRNGGRAAYVSQTNNFYHVIDSKTEKNISRGMSVSVGRAPIQGGRKMIHERTGSSSARSANITAACTMAIALMGSNLAQAVNHCAGSLQEYLVYSDGGLMIYGSWRNDWTYLCNLQGSWNGIPSETCFSWLAIVGSAKAHNKPLMVYYPNDVTCSSLPSYGNSPAPGYVRITQ
jgi:hypothetical protein